MYDFSTQKELFDISCQILSDYEIIDWSFGGGTALSAIFYQHRVSYDIDIFSEDFKSIDRLISNQEEIAKNLGIDMISVKSSTSGVTFGLDNGSLKLDFIYSTALTKEPYIIKDIFDYSDIKVQTPIEIIAKKLKYREKATIRDFVDYAIVEEHTGLLTKLKSKGIVDIDRYFDVVDKFNNFDKYLFDEELKYLLPDKNLTKDDFYDTINGLMRPKESIRIACDHTNEVVAFDEFIEAYRDFYEELGRYSIYTIKNSGISYRDILNLKYKDVLVLSNKP